MPPPPYTHNSTHTHTHKSARKHRNNAMRCVLVGEERDGEVMRV